MSETNSEPMFDSLAKPLPREELIAQLKAVRASEASVIKAAALLFLLEEDLSRIPVLAWFRHQCDLARQQFEAMLAGSKYEIDQLLIELSRSNERRMDEQV